MDDLRQFFRQSVIDRLARVEQLTRSIGSGAVDDVETLRRLAGALRDSGAIHDCPRLCEAASRVEAATGDRLLTEASHLAGVMREISHAGPRHRVLIVGGDPAICHVLSARIDSDDRSVDIAGTLEAARRLIRDRPPHLIILDVALPDGNGGTLLDEIRLDETTSALPVVVIGRPFDPDETARRAIGLLAEASTVTAYEGRGTLTSAYRSFLRLGLPITVASLVAETHGPGGRRSDGPDPALAPTVRDAVAAVVGTPDTVGSWDGADVMVVSRQSPDQLRAVLDRVRLRLRNAAHPFQEGALASFSAAIVADDGGRGLHDAHARAQRFALDFNRAGGDRVAIHSDAPTNRRVLLAGGDAVTAALIIDRLEQEGFEVTHHPDGVSAIESIEDGAFGMVLLDVQMPETEGFEVLRRVRALRHLDGTPVVLLAAEGGERDVVRGFALGADDYILKPFSPAELAARLTRLTGD